MGIDVLILGMALVALVTSVFLIFEDGYLLNNNVDDDLISVGRVSQKMNDVRRRLEVGFAWRSIKREDIVYEGDSLFTGDDSTATVDLDQGGQLLIDPKSLVVVHTKDLQLEVDLQYGSLLGKVNKNVPILLSQNGVKRKLTATNAEIKITRSRRNKKTQVHVLKGEVQIQPVKDKPINPLANLDLEKPTPSESQVLRENESLDLKTGTSRAVQNKELVLIAPTPDAILWATANQKFDFKWSILNEEEAPLDLPLTFEVSRDPDFKEMVLKKNLKGKLIRVGETQLAEGNYFWRVSPVGGDTKSKSLTLANGDQLTASEVQRFTVYENLPPTLLSPQLGEVIQFDPDTGETAKQVDLKWEQLSPADHFEYQIQKIEEELNPPLTTELSSATTGLLAAGIYQWRVRGHHPTRRHPPWSSWSKFIIQEGARTPEIPIISNPELSYVIPRQVLDRLPASLAPNQTVPTPEDIESFRWDPVPNSVHYDVEVAKDPSFEHDVQQYSTTQTSFVPKRIAPGSLYVRIQAMGRDQKVSGKSKPGELLVRLAAPHLDPVPPVVDQFKNQEELKKGNHQLSFSWKPQPYVDQYEFIWGADANFIRSKSFNLKSPSHSLTVSNPADYFYKVRSLASDGSPLSDYSATMVASYNKELLPPPVIPKKIEPPLASPILIEPENKTKVVSVSDAPLYIDFKWKSPSKVDHFTLQIATDSGFTQILSETTTQALRYAYRQKIPSTQIYWRVKGHFGKRSSNWSSAHSIHLLQYKDDDR